VASWERIARRVRVPTGFALAIVYLWLARPTWASLTVGALIAIPGLSLRAAASGHVRKNAELTTTGPYAYVRHPLYVGSVVIALGFALAARNPWLVLLMAAVFLALYVPVMRSEERYLRAHFPGFDDYARRVPGFLPRLTPATRDPEAFSRQLYLKHREYNALLGTLALLAALAAKILWYAG
jgi:protein-S-isoprenylcysteine O-methyltransferase Ste14